MCVFIHTYGYIPIQVTCIYIGSNEFCLCFSSYLKSRKSCYNLQNTINNNEVKVAPGDP